MTGGPRGVLEAVAGVVAVGALLSVTALDGGLDGEAAERDGELFPEAKPATKPSTSAAAASTIAVDSASVRAGRGGSLSHWVPVHHWFLPT